MVESYKYKSQIATAAALIAGLIVYIGKDNLASIVPPEYANWIPIIVMIAGYVLAQVTENKRVEVAEQMVHEEYQNVPEELNDPTIDEILIEDEDEEIVGEDDGA